MQKDILAISNKTQSGWLEVVADALCHLGTLHKVPDEKITNISSEVFFDLVLIDSSATNLDTLTIVKRLQFLWPQVPIIVFTTSPTWEMARDVLRAGAVDYVYRTFDKNNILLYCQNALGV